MNKVVVVDPPVKVSFMSCYQPFTSHFSIGPIIFDTGSATTSRTSNLSCVGIWVKQAPLNACKPTV